MPGLLRRLLKSPKTLLGLMLEALSFGWSDLLANFNSLWQQYHALVEHSQLEPGTVKVGITALFALLGLWAFFSALARRSLLLQPERFIINAEDPRHLIGRGKETENLARVCIDNPLTILKGESGAGKSALVKAGLRPSLEAAAHSPLSPLLIDASGLDWDGGLRTALAQALAASPKERRQRLGDVGPAASAEQVFKRLGKLPELASQRLLLILDQIDDYFVAHREHFLQDGVVAKPEALQHANPDWAALADLLRRKRLHLLLVCRKDEDMLSALHCIEPTYFSLARIEANLISPLLEHITAADEHGPVVEDPQAGWLQLKARLLRDLAEGGQILPVRLVLALDSLRSFRCLTLAQYSKRGGTRGLDRLYVEKHLQDAKHALGLEPTAVLRALALLAEEDGTKTRRVSLADFTAALSSGPNPAADAKPLLDLLEQNRLLRRQSGPDGSFLLLYHDYLARGVRDAYQQANRWTELLKAKAKEFDEALSWRQRWRALLSVQEQTGLLLARLRGRFNYGIYRGLAACSLLRTLPVMALLAALVLATGWVETMRQEQMVANLLNRVGSRSDKKEDELEAWQALAGLNEAARLHAVWLAYSNPGVRGRLSDMVAILAHAVLGFDPDGNMSSRIVREHVRPCIHHPSDEAIFCAHLVAELHLQPGSPIYKEIAAVLVERMKTETDSRGLSALGEALAGLAGKLDGSDVKPAAATLTERMKTETDSDRLSELGKALAGLASKLDDEDAKQFATTLTGRMKTETDLNRLSALSRALAGLAVKLDGGDVKPAAAVLVERMKTETDSGSMSALGKALAWIVGKLDGGDVKPAAAVLVERMKTETDSFSLSKLGEALAGMAGKLDSGDVKPAAAVLVERMKIVMNPYSLSELGEALAGLAGKLDGGDAKQFAATLVERMKAETDYRRLSALGRALARLADKLDVGDVKPAAAVLVERMKTEADSYRLSVLGRALAGLIGKLDGGDVKPAAAVLVKYMKTNYYTLSAPGKALAGLVGKLEGGDVKPAAAMLAERMKTETDYYELPALGEALAGLADKLDSGDAKPLAVALVERMKAETDSHSLSALGEALAGLAGKLDGDDVKPLATALLARINVETEPGQRFRLYEALAHLSANIKPEDSPVHIADYVKFLRDPVTVGDPRKALLEALGKTTHQDFHGDLWQFVDWAQTEQGRKLVPSLQ